MNNSFLGKGSTDPDVAHVEMVKARIIEIKQANSNANQKLSEARILLSRAEQFMRIHNPDVVLADDIKDFIEAL